MCAFVEGLPPDAAVNRTDGHEWTDIHELLATIAERVDQWGRLTAGPYYKGTLPGEPLEVPRPGEVSEAHNRIETDRRKIAAWFGSVGA